MQPDPKSDELECQLLAGCLIDPSAIDRLDLAAHHWFSEGHAACWELLQDMRTCGDPVDDVQAVAQRLKARGIWERLGGMNWLRNLFIEGQVHRYHVDFYARELVRLANLQRLVQIGEKIIAEATAQGADPQAIATTATAAIAARMETKDDVQRLDELAGELLDELDRPKNEYQALFTGWPAFDTTFGPLVGGESTIIGARSSIGKTAAMLQLAMYAASHDRPVLFASLEMPSGAVRDRLMCALARIESAKFRSRELDEADKRALAAAKAKIDGWPIYIWSPRGRKTVARISAKARSVHAEHKLRLLCIDYLGKIHAEDKRVPREEQVASFARGVKDIAMDLGIPVVTGCQLNRQADHDEEPALHHLRESGAVEQEADVVVFVHRKDRLDLYGKFIVAKFRQGTPGELKMTWNPLAQEFTLEAETIEDHPNYDRSLGAWNQH